MAVMNQADPKAALAAGISKAMSLTAVPKLGTLAAAPQPIAAQHGPLGLATTAGHQISLDKGAAPGTNWRQQYDPLYKGGVPAGTGVTGPSPSRPGVSGGNGLTGVPGSPGNGGGDKRGAPPTKAGGAAGNTGSTPPGPPPLDATAQANIAAYLASTGNKIAGYQTQMTTDQDTTQNALNVLAQQQPLAELKAMTAASGNGGFYGSAYGQQLGNINSQYGQKQQADQTALSGKLAALANTIAGLNSSIPLYEQEQGAASAQRLSTLAEKDSTGGSAGQTSSKAAAGKSSGSKSSGGKTAGKSAGKSVTASKGAPGKQSPGTNWRQQYDPFFGKGAK